VCSWYRTENCLMHCNIISENIDITIKTSVGKKSLAQVILFLLYDETRSIICYRRYACSFVYNFLSIGTVSTHLLHHKLIVPWWFAKQERNKRSNIICSTYDWLCYRRDCEIWHHIRPWVLLALSRFPHKSSSIGSIYSFRTRVGCINHLISCWCRQVFYHELDEYFHRPEWASQWLICLWEIFNHDVDLRYHGPWTSLHSILKNRRRRSRKFWRFYLILCNRVNLIFYRSLR
jgi:hypothetical protein